MVNEGHLKEFNKGVDPWNQWRRNHLSATPDFTGAILRGTRALGVDLRGADFRGADLREGVSPEQISAVQIYIGRI